MTPLLIDRLVHSATTVTTAFADPAVYGYNSTLGMPVAREAAAYFLARHFLHPDQPNLTLAAALHSIQPRHVALSSGAAAVLHSLFFLLGSAGDACLIPAPYYSLFEQDMNLVAGIIPFAIAQANPLLGPTESELTLAYIQAQARGWNPRFVLLTNPNNPLAVIYRPEVMLRTVAWARKRGMHTLVDEIYALSTHQVRVCVYVCAMLRVRMSSQREWS